MTGATRQAGLEGDLQALSVVELVQTLNLGGKTARVTLHSGSQTGTMWFEEGAMTHAAAGPLLGELAAYSMIEWTKGRFSVNYGITTESRSIDADTTQVLLEALRRADERSLNPRPNEEPIDVAPVLETDVRGERASRWMVGITALTLFVGAMVIVGVLGGRSSAGTSALAAALVTPDPVVPRATLIKTDAAKRTATLRPRPKPKSVAAPEPASEPPPQP